MHPAPLDRKKLGKLLEKRRLEISAKRLEVATAAGISANYYGAVERGSITPPNSTLSKIIRALQVSPDEETRILELAALNRRLQRDDAGLPDEVSGLIVDIRQAAFVMPTRFVKELRARIREISS